MDTTRDLSLEEIEHDKWGEPPSDATRLIATVYNLRRKPIGSLTPEDMRLLISQGVGLEALMPQVLAQLEQDALLEGDFYPGDVLAAVLRCPPAYWAAHPPLRAKAASIAARVARADTELAAAIHAFSN
ncbi:MAG TPA: contact-dependent growth inhibition system immunity protein [Candidatus Saccharimonadales bacterium]|nr:contact-dependent growth inhibition system immunity protein [Candidatus Saccharimonadales bacterium]